MYQHRDYESGGGATSTGHLHIDIETDDLGDLGLEVEVTSEGNVEAFGLLDEGEHAVRLRVVDTPVRQPPSAVDFGIH